MNHAIRVGLGLGLFVLTAGCSLFNSTPTEPPPSQPPTGPDVYDFVVNNTTDVDICSLHIREDTLHHNRGWSSNELSRNGNPSMLPASKSTPIKVQIPTPLEKPDVRALDCAGNTVMQVYDKPEFRSAGGSTWTIARVDEGTIADARRARGIQVAASPTPSPAPPSSGGGIIEISLMNKCGSTVEYCHASYAKSPSSLNSGATQRITVKEGDTITRRSGSSCGEVVYTVSQSSNGQEVVLCK